MMKHTEAKELLVEFADGTLGEQQRAAVAGHVRSCDACDRWLGTYNLVAGAINAASHHPTADAVAAYANEPADLPGPKRSELEAHLGQCSCCAREYELTRQALEASRSADALTTSITGRLQTKAGHLDRRWLAAAALAAAATLTIAMTIMFRASETLQPPETVERHVQGERFVGHKVIDAPDRLVATDVHVETDSSLTLRAGKTVLGEHFSVGRGGRLVIATTGASEEAPTNTGKTRGGKT